MRTLCGGSIESVRTSMETRWIRAETLAPLPAIGMERVTLAQSNGPTALASANFFMGRSKIADPSGPLNRKTQFVGGVQTNIP